VLEVELLGALIVDEKREIEALGRVKEARKPETLQGMEEKRRSMMAVVETSAKRSSFIPEFVLEARRHR
jgi:hypothetical protein